jgi:hypothetical protein
LFDEAILKAQQSVPAKQGAEYEQKVESIYRDAVNALPWDVVQDVIKSARSVSRLLSESFLLGDAAQAVGFSARAFCKVGCNRILERFLWVQ